MQLSAWIEHPDHVCSRYRLRPFQSAFERLGYRPRFRSHSRTWWSTFLDSIPDADVGIIQRRLPSRFALNRMRRAHRHLIFDFDDAIWSRDSYSFRGLKSSRRESRFRAMIESADRVVAGNAFLARHASRFTSSNRVAIIPTCVEPSRYELAKHDEPDQIVRIVWIGSSSTLQGLQQITPILEQIGKHLPRVRLKLICDRFIDLRDLRVECCRWQESTEARDLSKCDIGLAWMPDDDWSRGKCGLKVLQYMAAGLPVIANPVGVHCEMVRHGESGFLVESATDWIEAVLTLANDREMRRVFGASGRARAEHDYSVSVGAEKWVELMSTLTTNSHLPRERVSMGGFHG